MAAPTLRNLRVAVATPGTEVAAGAVVAAGRALVVSKLIVANSQGSAATISLGISSAVGNYNVAGIVVLSPGEVYTETGLIVTAGENVRLLSNVAGVVLNVFGQEVDNV